MTAGENVDEPMRWVVGIDLGTTNSAVCYVNPSEDPWVVRVFPVPQLVAPAQIEDRETLPSFHYDAADNEFPENAFRLPWGKQNTRHAVGSFARDQGMLVPGRLISSAKSWLCHSGVDRTAELLPWHGADDVAKLSPVEAGSRYLSHIREAWNHAHRKRPLEEQDIVITLPASFDEVARELTVAAAQKAGLPRVTLIEEPQAAFYAWIHKHADDWEQRVSAGQVILVCDIGGGTSDFTLIRVENAGGGKVRFHRLAVGEHLILGGDNLDLALAHFLEHRFPKLNARQWDVLTRNCRVVKETLLGEDAPEHYTVTIPGSGSSLIGGSLSAEVNREEVESQLVDGFLPFVEIEAKPQREQSGFREFGLPYAADAAITKHLAEFLRLHAETVGASGSAVRPDIVLFNGGLFASSVLRRRVVEVVSSWFEAPNWSLDVLENDRLDLAVARGAAYYGMVCRGEGVRIDAGLARTYYIGVAGDESRTTPHALCVVPAGIEPGEQIVLDERPLDLLVSAPVEFPIYVSSLRLNDQPGAVVEVDGEQLRSLPPIRTVFKVGNRSEADSVPVHLVARLTEIGTLDLWCREIEGRRRWRLQFDIRAATQTDIDAHSSQAEGEGVLDESLVSQGAAMVQATFRDREFAPEKLAKSLGATLSLSRKDWPTSLLRALWEMLIDLEAGRTFSAEHESRWLNLVGFCLRPGFGFAMDDWRVSETWRVLQGNLRHATPVCLSEWWVLWRRVAGGLTAGQQTSLAAPLLAQVRQFHRQLVSGKGKGGDAFTGPQESREIWRLLGSFELLPSKEKKDLGAMILDLYDKNRVEPFRPAMLWALGRIGSRQPWHGPLNSVVSPELCSKWVARLLSLKSDDPGLSLTLMQLARRTGDRHRDLAEAVRSKVAERLRALTASDHLVQLVEKGGTLKHEERAMVFGEALPQGLRLEGDL